MSECAVTRTARTPRTLTVRVHSADRMAEFWMVLDAATGRELGSYVPATKSARVGPALHKGVGADAALALFAEYAAKPRPDLARAGDGFLCTIG